MNETRQIRTRDNVYMLATLIYAIQSASVDSVFVAIMYDFCEQTGQMARNVTLLTSVEINKVN